MTAVASETSNFDNTRSEVARAYFRRTDYRRPDPLDLVSDDVTIHARTFGEANGKAGMADLAQTLGRDTTSLEYDHNQAGE